MGKAEVEEGQRQNEVVEGTQENGSNHAGDGEDMEVLKKKGRGGRRKYRECVFPRVSRLSCRVLHHCVPGDCVCGLVLL